MIPNKADEGAASRGIKRRRLVLYLSGEWNPRFERSFSQDDDLFCAPGFAKQAPKFDWQELPRFPRGSFNDLAKSYTDLLFPDDEDLFDRAPWELANTHFEYGISPVAAQLLEIDRLIAVTNPASIVVIAPKSKVRHIPVVGISTTESSLGSQNLLGALTARAIFESSPVVPSEWIVARGDLLTNPLVRYVILRLAAITVTCLAAIRIAMSSIGTWKNLSSDTRVVVSVRSVGQSRHASRLFGGLENVATLVTPQFTGRNRMREITKTAGADLTLFRPAGIDVLRALARSILGQKDVSASLALRDEVIHLGRFSLPVSRVDLAREMRLVPFLEFHKALMEGSIARLDGAKKLVSFEIKGTFATVAAIAGRTTGVQTATIQTVLVQPRPLPIFPLTDTFFADGLATAEVIRSIGQRRAGQVVFAGSPHAVVPITLNRPLSSVVFLSQPYETPQTLSLLRVLTDVARNFDFRIRIRLHPRDDRETYKPLLKEAEDVLEVCDAKSLGASIAGADVCVTRTSSAAKEALAAGKPIMTCLWSGYDRSIVADYIARDALAEQYIANDASRLRKVLGDVDRLIAANIELQSRLFGGAGPDALRTALLN